MKNPRKCRAYRILVSSLHRIFLSPVPASLTLSEFSTVRSLFMVIPLTIISSLGFYSLISRWRFFYVFPVLGIFFFNVLWSLDIYFIHTASAIAKEYNYGQREAVQEIIDNPASKVVMTDVYGQPYIYYLFYTKFDPATYQKMNSFVDLGLDVGKVDRIGNVEFHQFSTSFLLNQKDNLFIGSPGSIPDNFETGRPEIERYRQINYPQSSDVVFRVIKTRK